MKKIIMTMIAITTTALCSHAAQEGVGNPPPPSKTEISEQILFCQSHLKAKQVQSTIVPAGTKVIVHAYGNPSTGYSWQSKESVESHFIQSASGAIGSGGTFVFELPVVQESTTYTFEYARSWDKKSKVALCVINVKVL